VRKDGKNLLSAHSHIGGKMQARKSVPAVGGLSCPESKASANDESGVGEFHLFFCFVVLTLP
jgi:hypothetical protein